MATIASHLPLNTRKLLEIEAFIGSKGPPIGNGLCGIKCHVTGGGMTSRDPKGQTRDPNRAPYLQNRCEMLFGNKRYCEALHRLSYRQLGIYSI